MGKVENVAIVANNAKNYSDDKKLYSGMKVEDIKSNPELMKLFNFADKDNDGQISELELKRYNGPIITQNYGKEWGSVNGNLNTYSLLSKSSGNFKGDIVKNNVVEFYSGLDIKKVPAAGRVTFAQIDSDKDGVLSAKEMNDASKILQKIKDINKKVDNNNSNYRTGDNKKGSAIWLGALGVVVTGAAALIAAGSAVAIAPVLLIGLGITGAIGTGFYLWGKSDTKSAVTANKNLLKEAKDIAGDNLYGKHLYETEVKPNAITKEE